MRAHILAPVLALIIWTFVVELWMYATRIPAIRAAGIDPARIKRADELERLPVSVKQVADNYNHLHEQPVVFYALAFYSFATGVADPLNVALAWVYVALRIAHSIVQCTVNFVPVRFALFAASSIALAIIAGRNAIALLVGAQLP